MLGFSTRTVTRWIGAALTVAILALPATLAAQEKVLRIGAAIFPDDLRTSTSSFAALSLALQTMDTLVLRNDDGSLKPGLAVSWFPTDDTTWSFKLRQGVSFHDGKPFTAADVVSTLTYILDPDTVYGSKSRISQIDGVRAIDDFTVEITTKRPFPTIIKALSDIPIEPAHILDLPDGPAIQGAHPIGTGPFIFSKWVPGDRYEVTANPNYWGGAPKVDRVVIREIPEGSTRVAALLAGEVDIIESVPVDLVPRVRSTSSTEVDPVQSTVGLVLTFDTRKPPFDDPRVRLAVDLSINKPLILSAILNNTGSLLQGQMLTSNTFGYNPNIKARPYDPARARKLLAEAGFPNGFKTSLTTRSGKYLSDVDIASAVSGELRDVGIDLGINVVEGGVFSQMIKAHDFGPIHMVGWFSLGDADFSTVWYTQASGRAFWRNDEYEKLFLEARSTVDQDVRLQDYQRMMEIQHEENPSVFMFGLPNIYAKSTRLVGWNPPSDKILRLATADF